MRNLNGKYIRLTAFLVFIFSAGSIWPAHSSPLFCLQTGLQKPLIEVLKELQIRYNVTFLYENVNLEGKNVDISAADNGGLEEVLNKILPPLNLKYAKIKADSYAILSSATEKENENPRSGIRKTVSGRVTSGTGENIRSAGIYGPDKKYLAATDSSGSYSVQIPDSFSLLMFSCPGYRTKKVNLTPNAHLNVVLEALNKEAREDTTGAANNPKASGKPEIPVQVPGSNSTDSSKKVSQRYRTGIGFRVQPYFNCVTLKHFFSPKVAVEGLLNAKTNQAVIELMAEFSNNLAEQAGLYWYYGLGGNIKFLQDAPAIIGGVGILGIEYTFRGAPINLSLDWKPSLEIINGNTFYPSGFGVSARFVLKRAPK